jgi:hypothetical protein
VPSSGYVWTATERRHYNVHGIERTW